MRLRNHAGFRLFRTAGTVSDFGTPIRTLAIQVLVLAGVGGRAGAGLPRCSPARSVPPLKGRRTHMTESPVEMGRSIVDGSWYLTLATADASGKPWASPVWFAHDGYREFVWASKPDARHSTNIAVRPQVGIVIFDSTVGNGGAQAVYLDAEASELHGPDRDRALAVYARRSVEFGAQEWTLADVTAPAAHRLFHAVPSAQYVLDTTDRRIPVALG